MNLFPFRWFTEVGRTLAIPTTAATTMPSGTETNLMEATGRDGPLRLTAGSENQGKIIIAADVKDLCSCSDTFLQSLFLFNLCSYSIFVLIQSLFFVQICSSNHSQVPLFAGACTSPDRLASLALQVICHPNISDLISLIFQESFGRRRCQGLTRAFLGARSSG